MSDLTRSLQHHVPGPEQMKRIERLRAAATVFAEEMETSNVPNDRTPASRCRAVAATKLEESVMWAVKGIVLETPKAGT